MAPSSKFILAFLIASSFSNVNIGMASGIGFNAGASIDGGGVGGGAQVGNQPGSNGGVGGQVGVGVPIGRPPFPLPRKVGGSGSGSGSTGGQFGVYHLQNTPGEVQEVAITGGASGQGGVSPSGIPREGGAIGGTRVHGEGVGANGGVNGGANGDANGGIGAAGIVSVP